MWVSATFQPMCGKWPSTAMCSTLTSLPSKTLFLCKGGVRITSIKSRSERISTAGFTRMKSRPCKKIMRTYGGRFPNCWRGFRRWLRCKRVRPRSKATGRRQGGLWTRCPEASGGFGVQPQQAFSQGENGECVDTRPACRLAHPQNCVIVETAYS